MVPKHWSFHVHYPWLAIQKPTHESEISSARTRSNQPTKLLREEGVWASSHRTEETQMLVLPLSMFPNHRSNDFSLGVWLVSDCHINSDVADLDTKLPLTLHAFCFCCCVKFNVHGVTSTKQNNCGCFGDTPPKKWTYIIPEKWWLGDDPFLLGRWLFRCRLLNFGGVSVNVQVRAMPVSKTTHTSDSSRTSACVVGWYVYGESPRARHTPLTYSDTLPKTNIAPENWPSQKKNSIPTIHVQVQTVSFRQGDVFSGYNHMYMAIHEDLGQLIKPY